LVERFDSRDGSFILVSLQTGKKQPEITAFFEPQAVAHNLLPTDLRIDNPNKGEDYGYFIDRYCGAVFDRWWRVGIFSLAPVAPRRN
jgi:hypothetical protein